jgi:hypothetical protein
MYTGTHSSDFMDFARLASSYSRSHLMIVQSPSNGGHHRNSTQTTLICARIKPHLPMLASLQPCTGADIATNCPLTGRENPPFRGPFPLKMILQEVAQAVVDETILRWLICHLFEVNTLCQPNGMNECARRRLKSLNEAFMVSSPAVPLSPRGSVESLCTREIVDPVNDSGVL